MAIEQHTRTRYIDWVRQVIGDPDSDIFLDDELKSKLDKWSCTQLSVVTPVAYNNRYKVCGCGSHGPVWQLLVTTGVDGAVYILDEETPAVFFDPDDDANTAVAPVDGTTITVQFYTMNTSELISELFFIMSSNHTKLTLAHNILGVQMDLTKLADSFYNQSIRWKIEGCAF